MAIHEALDCRVAALLAMTRLMKTLRFKPFHFKRVKPCAGLGVALLVS